MVLPGTGFRVGSDSTPREWVYVGGDPIEPATVGSCVAALGRLCARPGSARWAAVGWATDLYGPWRSRPRAADDGRHTLPDLLALIDRLAPEPAREVLPTWLHGQTGANAEALLELGVGAGKEGRRFVTDAPRALARHIVAVGPDSDLVRFTHPAWTGDPLTSDVRIAALRLLASRAPVSSDRSTDVETLVQWCVGPGRADIGTFARVNPREARPGETSSHGARLAPSMMENTSVADVVAAVLA